MFSREHLRDIDRHLLQDGAINLFPSREALAVVRATAEENGYETAEIFCQSGRFQAQMSAALKAGYGGNENQLVDGFRYYPFGPRQRSALIFYDFHLLVSDSPKLAWSVLNIMEITSRDHLLEGNFLTGLVHTDDASYTCDGIGARSARWHHCG